MTRLVLCIFILGGTVAFLSCGDSLDGNSTGKGGSGAHGGSSGTATDGTGAPTGCGGGCDGAGPGGTGWSDGSGPFGGNSGCPAGLACDGVGPIGGRGGAGAMGTGGTGGSGGTGSCDALGTGCAGRGGTGGNFGPCDGLGYFEQSRWCAPTKAEEMMKGIFVLCSSATQLSGSCAGQWVSAIRYASGRDPSVCAYDGAGNLVGARICTNTPMPEWNCNGATTSPACLAAGTAVPDISACSLTGGCYAGDGAGPIGGRGGS